MDGSTEIIRAKMRTRLATRRGDLAGSFVMDFSGQWTDGIIGFVKLFVNLTRIGWLGVNLFSVLSGFLITGILADSKTNKHYYPEILLAACVANLTGLFYALLLVLSFIPSQSKAYMILSFFYLSNLASPRAFQ